MDPLAGSPWSAPATVAGFVRSPPNDVLLQHADRERMDRGCLRALDIGCGAGRNAIPLARSGWDVIGTDLSWPMLAAAWTRAREERLAERVHLAMAPMDRLPIATASADFVIAHGIWNLARSEAEFRRGMAEAARVARPGASLFVFTFSRHTLPPDAEPLPGETMIFTQFSGQPQCFLTAAQLLSETSAAGFTQEAATPIREYNRSTAMMVAGGGPVIYEAVFRRTA